MYRVSVENNVVNFTHELSVIGEMIRVVYKSLIRFASRLCSLEKRISSFQDQGGYRWIDGDVCRDVTSDFYSYIKVNQRHILADLNELNTEFLQCKKKAETLIYKIHESDSAVVFNIDYAPVVNEGNIIHFKNHAPTPHKEEDVVQSLAQLLAKGEELSRDIYVKHQAVSTKADTLISQMRGQLQG